MIWAMTIRTSTDIVIGPWLRNIPRMVPMTGRSVIPWGSLNAVKLPALVGELFETIVLI